MTDIAKFGQFSLSTFYNAIPVLDNASDWFQWNQKVNKFVQISAVAEDGAIPPAEEEEAQQWHHRQRLFAAMIAEKLTHSAAERVRASEFRQVQPLLQAVKENFKPEGSGTLINLHRQYQSLTRERCGSVQMLGSEIRRIHTEQLLLDPECTTREIMRTLLFMDALGADYEDFRNHIYRQMDLVNDRDADGNIIKAAPTFDYIEGKAIEEEHRKGQLARQPVGGQALPALAATRGPGQRRVVPSPDGKTCRIENVPYCLFCKKPYHLPSECFTRNPSLKDQGKGRKGKPKRQRATNDDDDDEGGPKKSNETNFRSGKGH